MNPRKLSFLAIAIAVLGGCSQSPGGGTASGGSPGQGGTTGSGGHTNGTTVGSGGLSGSGGTSAAGGTSASGGTTTTGGVTGAGGKSASGGTSGSGGAFAIGGTLGNGGATASGGTLGNGGVTVTGGTSGTGGRSGTDGAVDAGSGGAGATGGGGSTGLGGSTGTGGGITAKGGTTGAGGTTGTGGTTTSGGASGAGGTTGAGGTIGSGGITSTGPLATNCPNAIPAGVSAEWCSCDQWGELKKGDITYYNDIWGSGAGPQCIWVAGNQWGVASNHPSGGSVKSYPNISFSPGKAISAYNTYTSSFQITVPSGNAGNWEYAYDIWVQNSSGTQVEIMLWVNYTQGKVFPAGSLGVSNVNTGGSTWNVYYGAYGGHDVVSLLRTANTSSDTVDIKAILNWIITNKGNFQSSWTLYQVQFGPEIVADSGVQGFTCNSFSVSSS